ncbi:hypothetical protein BZJ17_16015 [Salinivibrio sp. IB574]|nr:hypothetical protein BZG23_16050 [Salinivibrio sp. ML290]OOF18707.1 hypothetical protein BZJ17_16015 [Salinivibrio sp. IB574]
MFKLGDLQWLIPILGGIYGYLLAIGTVPRNPKNSEKLELWRRKFGKMMKILCPFIVVFGFLKLFSIL